MDVFSPKERLIRTLNKEKVERQPVICPGGMMNSAITEIMTTTGNTLPEAHHTKELMSRLALDVQGKTGFENFGVPFCMTIEAEVLGSKINFGSLECEPKIDKEAFPSVLETLRVTPGAIGKSARGEAVIGTIYELSKNHPDIPAIGSLTGPISTAASVVDPMIFLKQLRRESAAAHEFMDYVSDQLIDFAKLMADNGASVISIADPTATGEILGPKMFGEYAVPYLNKIADAVHAMGKPVIIHICGKIAAVEPLVAGLHADAISVDAIVNIKSFKRNFPYVTTMGNLSTYLLQFGEPEQVLRASHELMTGGPDIAAPACGLGTGTPLKNIRAFTGEVTEG